MEESLSTVIIASCDHQFRLHDKDFLKKQNKTQNATFFFSCL